MHQLNQQHRNRWTLACLPILLSVLLLNACDGAVELCGQYACVYYQTSDQCEGIHSCTQARQCESAGSIRDRAPRILNQLRDAQRRCNGSSISTTTARLDWNATLANASEAHARDMASNNVESFTGSDGLSTAQRVASAGFNSSIVVESITSGAQTSAEAINSWLDINTDCQQMLQTNTSHIGMACALPEDKRQGPYWSLLLAGEQTPSIESN